MRDGPSCLKPLSASRKRIRKQKKKELTLSPFDDLLTIPLEPIAAIESGTMAKPKAQETPTSGPTLPKEVIEQYTLSVTPRPGAGLEEMEEAIRAIESPCGNVVWSSSWTKKPTRGGGPVTLEINVIYNDCGHRRIIPYSCRKNRIVHGATHWDLPPHGEALRMKDVAGHVRGLADLVAACEVVARKSWELNAVSHGGTWHAS
ncbi:hypothetical protein UCDDA912_g09379 [Diaporthe ampelina]|uniref:Uncharacterized protein n=1 Tax=Diaporthe ampelina TaxID=1214573 RepID=A0A0G2F7H9_9PEZI|nr:hypothetical protein UCDDA912_g09379 [Diaporthe ampelina]